MVYSIVAVIYHLTAIQTQENWLGLIPLVANPYATFIILLAITLLIWMDSVTLVLVSRLVLNLRQVSYKQEPGERTLGTIDTIRDPVFAANSLLGNIGAQLRIGPDEHDGIEETSADDEFDVGKRCEVADEKGDTEDSRSYRDQCPSLGSL
ncbi:hypothetical protein BD410DRAFT_842669 [Rickenella mellea]|uniref:Uncharacterized protein n=1 Tax=Rickenella mellea TaxID=50990 RepID=A0A4Y7PUB4_9AGAM|nr:hypothetical protein BD410DRAFT_842669 [Rickenella mellea]